MEYPKDVICISNKWHITNKPSRALIGLVNTSVLPIIGNVYTALAIRQGHNNDYYYILKDYPSQFGFVIRNFTDLNDINIKEVTEILKEEPCLI